MEKTGNTLDTERQLLKLTRNKTKAILGKNSSEWTTRLKEKIRLNEQREEELYFEKRKLEQQANLGSNADKAANPEQAKNTQVFSHTLVGHKIFVGALMARLKITIVNRY
mgnify:CR=1 FL=1